MFHLLVLSALALSHTVRCAGTAGTDGYSFEYRVKDDYSGQDFGQEETRAGYNTQGEYEVQLPDGRRQIVRYSVTDQHSGYIADVQYQGEARYDDDLKISQTKSHPTVRGRPALVPAVRSRPALVPTVRSRPALVPAVRSRPALIPTVRNRPALVPTVRSRPALGPAVRPASPRRQHGRRPVVNKRPVEQTRRPVAATPTRKAVVPALRVSSPARKSSSNQHRLNKIRGGPEAGKHGRVVNQPAVYIPSRTPKTAEYGDIFHIAESKMLGSLFRGDIKHAMTPPKKIPAQRT